MRRRASSNARLPAGGDVERSKILNFTYEGRALRGFAGDTLASALLANGVSVFGRSFKYHRPRGLLAAGVEEPNALMAVGSRSARRVNVRATEIELEEGLDAAPVNCWPSARFDLASINDVFSRFLSAGFYYKSFMWPSWALYEPMIRRAAGLGVPSSTPDRSIHDNLYAHSDLLIVGGGAAGLAAARVAAAAGARTILVEQDVHLGGALRWRGGEVAGVSARAWIDEVEAGLEARVRVLTRTTALGYFDHNEVLLSERIAGDAEGRTRLWRVRAKQVILAVGAIERPIVFPGNDRPNVMLASGVHRYLGQYGVRVGRRLALFANNEAAHDLARAYAAAGGEIAAIIDPRSAPAGGDGSRIEGEIIATEGGGVGDPAVRAILVRGRDGARTRIEADVVAMSGGWSASLELFRQSGGRGGFDNDAQAFLPAHSVQAEQSAGACNGALGLEQALEDGHRAALAALGRLNLKTPELAAPSGSSASAARAAAARAHRVAAKGRAFVDFQNDVTASDIELAVREGFRSPEHVKRYTTLGMAPDQGKTSNLNGLAILADLSGAALSSFKGPSHRFPYTPIALGALSGLERGALARPYRMMACHDAHVALGARLEEYGSWLRPAFYGVDEKAAIEAEIDAVRHRAGIFDASPLGKIEVKGPDAAKFLDRVYANTMSTLKPGRLRYGLMLNEFGIVIDDGVTARLSEDEFLVGTTGAGAERISAMLEEWLQCEWRELDVVIAPVTQAWGVVTLSGPKARAVLVAAGVDFDVSPEAFPHMHLRAGVVAGLNARVARVSFTGEVSFEVSVAADVTGVLWRKLSEAGASLGLKPVGIEAWMHLRTEKGFLHIGADTDGTTNALDVGWSHVLKRKSDFIGRRSLMRVADQADDRPQFVGLELLDGQTLLPVGSHLREAGADGPSEGHVTSSVYSRVLVRPVALAMVRGGRRRMGEIVHVKTKAGTRRARIVTPGGYDLEGARLEA